MGNAALTLTAERVTAEAFSRFGEYVDLGAGGDGVVTTIGDDWTDRRSLNAVIETPGHLGFTLGSPTPFTVCGMERHHHTKEVLLCAADPIVVAVADGGGDAPDASNVRAFLLEPGDVIVLREGIWHTACHGVGKSSYYYWMATADDSIVDEWILPVGPAVEVTVEPSPSGALA